MVPTVENQIGLELEQHFKVGGVAAAGEASDLGFVASPRAEERAFRRRRPACPAQQKLGREGVEQDCGRRPGGEHTFDFCGGANMRPMRSPSPAARAIRGAASAVASPLRTVRRSIVMETSTLGAADRGLASPVGPSSRACRHAARFRGGAGAFWRRPPPPSRWRDSRAPVRRRIRSAPRRRLASPPDLARTTAWRNEWFKSSIRSHARR